MLQQKKVKGFTLIELIIAIAILSVLLMILIPSINGYINLAKKKANVANAKTIYMQAVSTLTGSEKAWESFYYFKNKNQRPASYEATPDGRAAMTSTAHSDGDVTHSRQLGSRDKASSESNYIFTVVARVDGVDHAAGGGSTRSDPTKITFVYNTWSWSNDNYKTYVEEMCNEISMQANSKKHSNFKIRMPYNLRDDNGTHKVIRWLIVYRWDDPDKVEVWAGDGYKGENGPVYRAYPDPSDEIL